MQEKTRVAVVDNHKMMGDGVKALLHKYDDVALALLAYDGPTLLKAVSEGLEVDVAVLDFEMPEMTGLELTERLLAMGLGIKIIIMSMHKEAHLVHELHQVGISGYILKENDETELINGIRTVHGGSTYWGKGVSDILLGAPEPKNEAGIHIVLTKREKEVLLLIAEGYTSKKAADKLFVSVSTVDTHRRSLMAKFEVDNTVKLVRAAQRLGLI